MKRTVTLDIAGAKYRMTSDADEAHLQRLAEMVDERIQALGSKALRAASPAQLLAVVALGLADDLLAADKRRDQLERLTREAIDRAIERIDSRLEEDAELAKKAE
ncbi:MAG: cell division protein ZapA [Myxococcota bacterium]